MFCYWTDISPCQNTWFIELYVPLPWLWILCYWHSYSKVSTILLVAVVYFFTTVACSTVRIDWSYDENRMLNCIMVFNIVSNQKSRQHHYNSELCGILLPSKVVYPFYYGEMLTLNTEHLNMCWLNAETLLGCTDYLYHLTVQSKKSMLCMVNWKKIIILVNGEVPDSY